MCLCVSVCHLLCIQTHAKIHHARMCKHCVYSNKPNHAVEPNKPNYTQTNSYMSTYIHAYSLPRCHRGPYTRAKGREAPLLARPCRWALPTHPLWALLSRCGAIRTRISTEGEEYLVQHFVMCIRANRCMSRAQVHVSHIRACRQTNKF